MSKLKIRVEHDYHVAKGLVEDMFCLVHVERISKCLPSSSYIYFLLNCQNLTPTLDRPEAIKSE